MGGKQNPCHGCTQCVCDYRRCDPYRDWICAVWQELRRHIRRGYWETSGQYGSKFTYPHPDMIRRYLQGGPCGLCDCAGTCEVPCEGYWQWWDARMVWLKWMMENGGRQNDSQNRSCIH